MSKHKRKTVSNGVNEFTKELSKYQELRDEELVKLVKAGEVAPYDELVRRHQIKIHDLCYKILRNYDDAKDMAQETFLKAYRKINKFGGRSKFSTWLYRIAVNNCLNFIKKRRPTEELFEEITGSQRDDPVQIYKNKKFREMIYAAVAELPKVQKAVFTLRTLQDFSYQEISDILKKPVSTIKVNHHLAVKNLRNRLRARV
ncbi:MAG: sigma-70 family RNA polymerase sigma factor [bacterium]